MALPTSDVASLSRSLIRWEFAEYLCVSFVTIACAGEYVADFTLWLTQGVKERKERLAKASTLLLIVSLSLELICLVKTNSISGMLIGSLSNKAEEADAKARSAIQSSEIAVTQSSQAVGKSSNANTIASDALALARGARQEADSFEKDIVSAKRQAADAESHLANALQKAASAERETLRLTNVLADRTLSDDQIASIAEKLKSYSGQQYEVTAYWESRESVAVAERINQTLQIAKWEFLPMTKPRVMLGGIVGILVWLHPQADERTQEAAASLTSALIEQGIDAATRLENPQNNLKHNKISLSVGSKR